MVRVLKPGGEFLFMAPKGEHGRAGFLLKRVLGFTADQEGFGHARDGYPPAQARALMQRHGLTVRSVDDYCRIFTESLEDLLNYAYHRKAMKDKQPSDQDFHGDTAPMSAEALNKVGTAYKVYSAIYPALRGVDHARPADPLLPRLHDGGPGVQGGLRCAASSGGRARRRSPSGRSAGCATPSGIAGPMTGACSPRAGPDWARGGSVSSTSPAGTSRSPTRTAPSSS